MRIDFRTHLYGMGHGACTNGGYHEFLERQRITGMNTTVENNEGDWENLFIGGPGGERGEVFVERDALWCLCQPTELCLSQ